MKDKDIERILTNGLDEGRPEFKENLLARCLEVLGTEENSTFTLVEERDLSMDELDLLAAAGTPYDQYDANHMRRNSPED